MGKAGIYVFLIILVACLIAVIALGVIDAYRNRRLGTERRTARWTEYLSVGRMGEITIGVRRRGVRTEQIFEGPIVLHQLASDHDPVDVQLKYQEAVDRASLYNALLEGKAVER